MSLIWQYGTYVRPLGSVGKARRNRWTGTVQFRLFKAGEQGYDKDHWTEIDISRWHTFKKNTK